MTLKNTHRSGRGNRRFPLSLVLLALSWIVLVSADSFSAERFDLYGLRLPQPKDSVRLAAKGRIAFPPDFAVAPAIFELDTKGRVSKLDLAYSSGDSLKFAPFVESLRALRFRPAEYKGKKIPFVLRARFVAQNSIIASTPRLVLPVSYDGAVEDVSLLSESCDTNGFHLPGPVTFPSYFYIPPPVVGDTMLLPPLVALRVEIDSSGLPVSRKVLFASRPDLGEMIVIAANWAEYRAGEFRGETIAGSGILVVQFYSELEYPTGDWSAAALKDSAGSIDRLRVSWFPENVDPLFLPTLRSGGNPILSAPLAFDRNKSKRALVQVSADARVAVLRIGGVNLGADRRLLKEKLAALRFHPGFRLSGVAGQTLSAERFFAVGALDLTPLDSLNYGLASDFSLRSARYPPSRPGK